MKATRLGLECFLERASYVGAIVLQGPHQSAWKSVTTIELELRVLLNSAGEAILIGEAILVTNASCQTRMEARYYKHNMIWLG